jgi:hypothetical protein
VLVNTVRPRPSNTPPGQISRTPTATATP